MIVAFVLLVTRMHAFHLRGQPEVSLQAGVSIGEALENSIEQVREVVVFFVLSARRTQSPWTYAIRASCPAPDYFRIMYYFLPYFQSLL